MQQPPPAPPPCTAFFWSGNAIRSRSVSDVVLSGLVDVPAPPDRLLADWQTEIAERLGLEPGDVEPLPLARARARRGWPDYQHCVQAVADWTRAQGLQDVLSSSDVALMACRGAKYHHDGAHYGGFAFCNLFLSEDKGLDLHFAASGQRIALRRGTVVVFDTGQPHAVLPRGSSRFDVADFPAGHDCSQVFLTWELPLESTPVRQALRIAFDTDPAAAQRLHGEQVWRGAAVARLCPASGRWLATG